MGKLRGSSFDLYGSRLIALGSRDEQHNHAFLQFGRDSFRINLDRHLNGAVEVAGAALLPVNTCHRVVRDRLPGRDANRVFLCLDFEAVLVNTWQLDDSDEIVTSLKMLIGGKLPTMLRIPRTVAV
jgi:hypothetical protein